MAYDVEFAAWNAANDRARREYQDRPFAWYRHNRKSLAVDEMAVERRLRGDRAVPINVHERAEVVRCLNRQGQNDCEISRRTGIPVRTVLRIRHRHGLPAAAPPGRSRHAS